MASIKLGSLLIRTLAKPIGNKIKQQAVEHARFRELCMGLAQWSHRSEVRLRTSLLGEELKHIKPLSEAKAVANGANMLAEGFLFVVAAGLILGETYRSSRSSAKHRDATDDKIDDLENHVKVLTDEVQSMRKSLDDQWEDVRARQEDIARILDRIVYIGMRGGWSDADTAALRVPISDDRSPSSQLSSPFSDTSPPRPVT